MAWDYVFIGAGPATLSAACLLSEKGVRNILIIDQGNTEGRRGCPGLKKSTCTHCAADACHVVDGIGGSSAMFGNKLCYLPASQSFAAHFSDQQVTTANEYLDILLSPLFRSARHSKSAQEADKKHYASDVLPRQQYAALIALLTSQIQGNVRIKTNTSVIAVDNSGDGFTIETHENEKIKARKVVLATGRSGHAAMRQFLDNLGVRYAENAPDIGLRMEAPARAFSDSYYYQEDPKYKLDHGALGSSRTFCACNGGTIAPVKYGSAFYAEGVFLDRPTPNNNLAFMVRARKALSPDALERWCAAINTKSKDNLLLGEVTFDSMDKSAFVESTMALIPDWPSSEHCQMMRELLQSMFTDATKILRADANVPVRVFGPAIDMYWSRPNLGPEMTTSVEGLYVIGDAAGISRGIVQALLCGAAWALGQPGSAKVVIKDESAATIM